jgi:hypothetical protein
MFFNTVHVRGQRLAAYESKAQYQEDLIAEFFNEQRGADITPEDIMKLHPAFVRTPITSIRRAFTNLASLGIIEKTDTQINGMYGMPIYCWRFKEVERQRYLF